MLYYIPIEPYETRYTADWVNDYEREFDLAGVNYTTVLGNKTSNKVTDGGVLDACGTHLYKFSQLQTIITKISTGEITDNDTIFFADLWFPGIESLFYIRNMLNVKFKICGIFHAGTYDFADFTYRNGMRPWGKYIEACWFEEIDEIFVATEFHKQLLIMNSPYSFDMEEKIFVTGLPFYADKLRTKYGVNKTDDNILVFPHRVDDEKHPELFDELVCWLQDKQVKFTPIKTIVETKSREEYFKVLAKSKVMVSFADQETFGYSTLESMALDNIVVVPNKLSYVETVPDKFRYDTKEECFNMVLSALTNYTKPEYGGAYNKWSSSIFKMLQLMGVTNV